MAIKALESVVYDEKYTIRSLLATWLAIPNGDQGGNLDMAPYQDRSVQVTGTFGVGGSITLQGSNDGGTTWATLTDPAGAAITFTAAGIKQILHVAKIMRPTVTAGDGTTSLNVYILMVRS